MLKNTILILALLALVSGLVVYGDNGVPSDQLVDATSIEPQVFGDIMSVPTNEGAVPSCHNGTDTPTAPACCDSTSKPRAPSCCGGA